MKISINDRINLNTIKITDGRTFLQWLKDAASKADDMSKNSLVNLKSELTPILKDIVKI
jgi:hypothetical protein